MTSFVTGLYARYRAHHDMNRSFLEWVGVIGIVAFPLFYLMRFTGQLPPRYDDLELRLVAVGFCLLLALRKWWPKRIEPFYLPFSYLAVSYCLSFVLAFTLLQNSSATNSVVNMAIGAILIILLADWRNAIVILLSGYGVAFAAYWHTHADPRIPVEFLSWWVPLCGLLVAGGALSKFGEKQAELRRMRLLYAGLAGSIAHEMCGPMQKIQNVFDTLDRDFLRAGRPPGQGSHSVEQLMAMARVVQEGRNAVRLGLQSITVTLQQLKTRAFDTSGFTGLSAAVCTERAVHEFAYDNELQRERVRFEELVDFTFKGDETVLTLILFNLLKNALYHLPTHPDSTVTLTVDTRRITVRDTGPGISPERMAHLFEDFQTSGKAEGTGLGLSFCRRAMRALGGEITCSSQLGEYTAFTLSFPAMSHAEAASQDDAVTRRAGELLRGCRVLVVDDDPLQRRATYAKLSALGGTSSIDEAGDGAQAVEILTWASLVPYDLVVTDLEMPVLDGHDLVGQMRRGEVPRHERVPVLAHSTEPATEARVRARRAGMDGFLRKPCGVPELARAIVGVLKDQPERRSTIDLAPFAGQTALLAEDNEVNRAIVRRYLEELGISVMEARQGLDVLQFVKAGARPAVIVMDIEMPGLGGMEATRQLRLMGEMARGIPVVALTGHASAEAEQAARAAGMDGFLAKPVNVAALRRELGRVLTPRPVGGTRTLHAAQAAAVDESLLDIGRIRHLRQMDIMASLLPEGLAKARRIVEALEHAFLRNDLRGARLALHALMGLNGEMGGHAVYETTRRHSLAVENGAWPSEVGWLERLKALMVESERALLASYGLGRAQL